MFKYVILSVDLDSDKTVVMELLQVDNPQVVYEKVAALNQAQQLFGSSSVRFEYFQVD